MKIKKTVYRVIAGLMVAIMLTGCGEIREVPELIEPLSDNQSFRPVSRRTIGKLNVEVGRVVPAEYSHYFERATVIKKINCNLGQYVNEGDVLVEADAEALHEELADLEGAYNLLVNKHTVNEPVYEYKLRILQQKKQACLYMYDDEGANEYLAEIKKEEENHTYDEQLYAYMVDFYQREIAEVKKNIGNTTVRARHSGYVTYVKDTAKGNNVNMNEAIVVIGDYDNPHIELPRITIGSNIYKGHEVKYALVDGREVPVEEDEFTGSETALAKAKGNAPNVRYHTVEDCGLKVGDSVIMGFIMNENKDALCIGYDSTNTDEAGNYVYVKAADGSLEKRYVQYGTGDKFYMEVVSGLEEGEEVYYVQETAKPVSYEEYVVEQKRHIQGYEGKSIKMADTSNTAYFSPVNGKIEEIPVSSGQYVKKGDVLVVIDTGEGMAQIQDVENEIKHLTMEYEKAAEDYDKQAADFNFQSLRLLTTIEEGKAFNTLEEYEIDAIGCQRSVYEIQAKITEIEKEAARLDYEETLRQLNNKATKIKKDNNGSGKVSIVAKEDCMVSKIYVTENKMTAVGGENYLLLSCTKPSEDVVQIAVGKEVTMPTIGSRITITDSNGSEYEAKVIGLNENGKAYAATIGDKVIISTKQQDASGSPCVFAQLTDPEAMKEVLIEKCKVHVDELDVNNVIVIPGTAVFYEESKADKSRKYFVWKIEKDQLVKTYVIKGTEYKIGNDTNAVIISGISAGDILANEVNQ